jgi:hypothetical protein
MLSMIGSTMRPAMPLRCSSKRARTESRSLNCAMWVCAIDSAGTPSLAGTGCGEARRPVRCSGGFPDTSTVSWAPWYAPSNLMMPGRPVYPRASRMACMVASVPEFAKRHWSWPKRARSSSATTASSRCGMACSVPFAACFAIASVILGWAWPTNMAPNASAKSV